MLEYNAALMSVCFMVFLGFADDVMDLPWRYKMLLPSIASMPLLVSYGGLTTVVEPVQLRFLLGNLVDIGCCFPGAFFTRSNCCLFGMFAGRLLRALCCNICVCRLAVPALYGTAGCFLHQCQP